VSNQDFNEYRDDDPHGDRMPPPSNFGGGLSSDERTWGMLAHFSALIAGIKANEGVAYRYPICIRFVK